jgi:hypothetical protein
MNKEQKKVKKVYLEKCYFCNLPGDYWDFLEYESISVCKNHILKFATS